MIVIFPLIVSKNVNTNVVQGIAVTLERYIAAYAMSDFLMKAKEFNKYYDYKIKRGKIYQMSDSSFFDLDPATRMILEGQESLNEVTPYSQFGKKRASEREKKKGVPPKSDPTKEPEGNTFTRWVAGAGEKAVEKGAEKAVDKAIKSWKGNKEDTGKEPIKKPTFTSASIEGKSISLEPTWVEVERPKSQGGGKSRLGIKVVPMMIEGFNIKHTISRDMEKYFIGTFITGIGRKIMRLLYRFVDRWTTYGQRPRGELKHDLFYARTGHDGQPFVLLDKNDDIPRVFFYQSQNMLKIWKMSWGNLLIADDVTKSVMFCMKKYKGMCTRFSYAMLFTQTKEMGKVFEDMEDARKATSSLFKFNTKITKLGGRK